MQPDPRRRRHVRRRRLTLVGLVAALVVVAVVLVHSGGSSPPSASPPSASPPSSTPPSASRPAGTAPSGTAPSTLPANPGPYAVGTTALALTEPVAGGAPRTLPTAVRYPATGPPGDAAVAGAPPDHRDGPYPLLVFSAGFDVGAEAYATLLQRWSAAGYVVADPTYPLTDPATGAVDESDIRNHPDDLRFVITSLLAASAGTGNALSGLVDPAHIAVVGHSDGGDVTLATATNSCCRDPRITAAVILSGAQLAAFGGSYVGGPSIPLLVTQGSADTINPPMCSVQLYDDAVAPKYYLDLLGEEHAPPYLDPGTAQSVVSRVTLDFLDGYLKGSAAALGRLGGEGTVPGVSTLSDGPTVPPVAGGCPGAPGG